MSCEGQLKMLKKSRSLDPSLASSTKDLTDNIDKFCWWNRHKLHCKVFHGNMCISFSTKVLNYVYNLIDALYSRCV